MKKLMYIINECKTESTGFYQTAVEAAKNCGLEFFLVNNCIDATPELLKKTEDKLGIKIYNMPVSRNPFGLSNIGVFMKLRKIIRNEKIEYIHCNTPTGGLLGRLLGKKCRVIYQAHGFHFYKGAPLSGRLVYYPVEKNLARKTDALITINSEDYKASGEFKLRNNGRRYYIPGVGINTEEYRNISVFRDGARAKLGLKPDDIAIVSAGRLDKNKNNSVLLDALAEKLYDFSKVQLLLCGTGAEEENLKMQAKKNGVEKHVHFLGNRSDMPEIYAAADIFVLASLREGLSRSIMEAMACKLPCVVSSIRGNIDLIENGVNGLCFSPTDYKGLAGCISALAGNSEKRIEYGERSLSKISEFDSEKVVTGLTEIYKKEFTEQKKRVLFIIGSMGRGGAERVVSILTDEYIKQGYEADIITLLSSEIGYNLNEKVTVHDFSDASKGRMKMLPYWLKSIRKTVKELKPDTVVSFVARINIITALACSGLKVKTVMSERNDPKKDGRSKAVDILTRIIYKKADAVIFQTKRARNGFPSLKNGVIIPNPVSVSIPPCTEEDRHDRIVNVGRLMNQKNQKLLIEAFAALADKYKSYKLEIYGSGELEGELKSEILRRNLENRVFLMGSRKNIHECIVNARLFVLSSDYEGLSNALLEAMSLGIPCISTDCAGSDEIIENGKSGIIVPVGDVDALANAIDRMLSDKSLRKTASAEGIKRTEGLKTENIISKWTSTLFDN